MSGRTELDIRDDPPAPAGAGLELDVDSDDVVVDAPMAATVWRVHVEQGDWVEAGKPLVTLEAMKLELPVVAQVSGRVMKTVVIPGDQVVGGAPLVVLGEIDEEQAA